MFDFGMRILQLRMDRNMSQEALGKKLGRSKSVVCGYENNLRGPPLALLVQIAVIFNVSLDYLVGIDKHEMISVEGLSDGQKKTIYDLVAEFKKPSMATPSLSDSQQAILNELLVEFIEKHNLFVLSFCCNLF